MSSAECHISSFIVYCLADKFSAIQASLLKLAELEVHASDVSGKFVIVVQSNDLRSMTQLIETISCFPGVIHVPMVYHQIDSNELELNSQL